MSRHHAPPNDTASHHPRLPRPRRARVLLLCLLTLLPSCTSNHHSSPATPPITRTPNGVLIPLPAQSQSLQLQVDSDNILRVACSKNPAFFSRPSLVTVPRPPDTTPFTVTSTKNSVTLTTAKLKAVVSLPNGNVSFFDRATGQPILAESRRSLTPATVQNQPTHHVRQLWLPHENESLYGLGQNQLDLLDLKGFDLTLWQHNTSVAVPFLVSNLGYGILWDNPSLTKFGDPQPFQPIPTAQLFDTQGNIDALTASYYADDHFSHLVASRPDPRVDILIPDSVPSPNRLVHPDLPEKGPISVRWQGELEPLSTGDYQFQAFSNGGIKLWIDGQLLFDHWRQSWVPFYDQSKIHLTANRRVKIRLDWTAEGAREVCQLKWKTPTTHNPPTSLWSEVADGSDYYFVYGPNLTDVIAAYRHLTGRAPMMPKWALGLWQSRERYKTQQESLDVVQGYRDRKIPFDNIVQDWFYWKQDAWGSHQFDPSRFPDPDAWIQQIHAQHAHLMISVWGKFYPGTDNFDAMNKAGYLYQPPLQDHLLDWMHYPYTFYDACNPGARKMFWDQINRRLFSKGIDAWWMDASEPELAPISTIAAQKSLMQPTHDPFNPQPSALSTPSRYLNAWSLLNSQAIYDGQRAAAPDQRVFILTRSAFAGQQRYAAATWSGDITSTWTALRKQIPAGLSFALSGLPWWTTDSGGFAPPPRFANPHPSPQDLDEWRELNVRWFQFAAFCPLMRLHGEFPYREFWQFGGDHSPAYHALLKIDQLRYRLLPYTYSLAAAVTLHDAMLLRPLVVDWPNDPASRHVKDQYLFGPSLLVAPVLHYKARSRPVYLPPGLWYNLWTGAQQQGGQTIQAPAPYDALPLYVRAGSILPTGPDLQYALQKPADPLTLHIYPGADAHFTLYEDDGTSYAYQRGAYTQIPLSWNDAHHTLTIAKRQGAFPTMLRTRTIRIIQAHPLDSAPSTARTITYDGTPVIVNPD